MKNFLIFGENQNGRFMARPFSEQELYFIHPNERERFDEWVVGADVGDVLELTFNRVVMRVGEVS